VGCGAQATKRAAQSNPRKSVQSRFIAKKDDLFGYKCGGIFLKFKIIRHSALLDADFCCPF
jgi:hypothetical protein